MRYQDPIQGIARAAKVRARQINALIERTPQDDYPYTTTRTGNQTGWVSEYPNVSGAFSPISSLLYWYGFDVTGTVSGTAVPFDSANVSNPNYIAFVGGQQWFGETGSGWDGESSRIAYVVTLSSSVPLYSTAAYESASDGLSISKRGKSAAALLCGSVNETTFSPPWVFSTWRQMLYTEWRQPSDSNTLGTIHVLSVGVCDANGSIQDLNACAIPRELSGFQTKTAIVAGDGNYFVTAFSFNLFSNPFYEISSVCGAYPSGSDDAAAMATRAAAIIDVSYVGAVVVSAKVTAAQIAGKHSAVGNYSYSRWSATCGGIPNTDVPALVKATGDFDFAATCIVSANSTAMPFVSVSKDATFEHPAFNSLQAENVGMGSAASRLSVTERQRLTDGKSYFKAATSGVSDLTYGDVSLVALKTFRAARASFPVDDADIELPASDSWGQTVFRFSGKRITGADLTFIPWSSNSFDSVEDIKNEQQSPTVTAPPTQSLSTTIFYSTATPMDNGIWFANSYPADNYGWNSGLWQRVGSVVNRQSTSHPDLYNRTTTAFPAVTDAAQPPLRGTYYPNVAFDEPGYLAAWLATQISKARDYGAVVLSNWSFGKLNDGATVATNAEGYLPSDFTDKHPYRWSGGTVEKNVFLTGYGDALPPLSGKTFSCASDSLGGFAYAAGVFHFKGAGESFTKTATQQYAGTVTSNTWSNIPTLQRYPSQNWFGTATGTQTGSIWNGSVTHTCTINTTTVEIYIKLDASLQSPGAYTITGAKKIDGQTTLNGYSQIAPQLWVNTADVANVTPILVASVWVRAVGKFDVSSAYTFAPALQMDGTYSHKFFANSISGSAAAGATETLVTKSPSEVCVISEGRTVRGVGESVPTSELGFRYLGAFPFNRAQTAQLLNGETVTPTWWEYCDEGTVGESLPKIVRWHNDTFGTYKLEFRLVTD